MISDVTMVMSWVVTGVPSFVGLNVVLTALPAKRVYQFAGMVYEQ